MVKKRPSRKFKFGFGNYVVMSMLKKEYMEKKRPSRKFNFGIGNYVVMSMLKKSIWKRKNHIENLILAVKLML